MYMFSLENVLGECIVSNVAAACITYYMVINRDFLTWLLIGWQLTASQSEAMFEMSYQIALIVTWKVSQTPGSEGEVSVDHTLMHTMHLCIGLSSTIHISLS